jgi:hypothetical protein
MHHFGWHSKILPKFSTSVESEVGSHQRQVRDRYVVVFASKLELTCFPLNLREMFVDECSYGRHPPAYKLVRCGT